MPNSQQNRVARAANNTLCLEPSVPKGFLFFFCLVPVVNSGRGAPAMSALAGNWRCCVSCSTLWFLLLSSASAFRNELLSVSPFHKKSTAQSKLIFFFIFFHGQLFYLFFYDVATAFSQT